MRFNKLDLNLLVVLDALLSTRSVSRTAEKVFLSQPATSLPTRLALRMAERLPLRVMPCPVEMRQFVENVQWHKYQDRDPAIVWLRALVKDVADGLPATASSRVA